MLTHKDLVQAHTHARNANLKHVGNGLSANANAHKRISSRTQSTGCDSTPTQIWTDSTYIQVCTDSTNIHMKLVLKYKSRQIPRSLNRSRKEHQLKSRSNTTEVEFSTGKKFSAANQALIIGLDVNYFGLVLQDATLECTDLAE